jgi:hypothetical protein
MSQVTKNKIMMKPDDTSNLYFETSETSGEVGRVECGRVNKSLFKLENPSLSCMNEPALVSDEGNFRAQHKKLCAAQAILH